MRRLRWTNFGPAVLLATGCAGSFFTDHSVTKTSETEYSDSPVMRGGCSAQRRAGAVWAVRCVSNPNRNAAVDDVGDGADKYGSAVCKNEGYKDKVVLESRTNEFHNRASFDLTMVVRCQGTRANEGR